MTVIGWLYIIIAALALWAVIATVIIIAVIRWTHCIGWAECLGQQRKEQEELSKRPMDYML